MYVLHNCFGFVINRILGPIQPSSPSTKELILIRMNDKQRLYHFVCTVFFTFLKIQVDECDSKHVVSQWILVLAVHT